MANERDKTTEDAASYEVGYSRPPTRTRFRKGQSGNPAGRKSGRENLKTRVRRELSRQAKVSKDGRSVRMPMFDVVIKRMVEDAARGDARAREQLLRVIGQIEATEPASATTHDQHTDREILARFRARLVAEIKENTDV